MVEQDADFVRGLINVDIVKGQVLELGAGYGGETCRKMIEDAGLNYFGTDIAEGPNVDLVADFENANDMTNFNLIGSFGTILVLNVLEHTFDPIRILDNALKLLQPGGALIVITPTIWPLHNFPMDAWRILPNFYQEYARRRNIRLEGKHFEYIGYGEIENYKNKDGSYSFPPPGKPGFLNFVHRGVHKLFNTFGRSMLHPSHLAVGAVFIKPGP